MLMGFIANSEMSVGNPETSKPHSHFEYRIRLAGLENPITVPGATIKDLNINYLTARALLTEFKDQGKVISFEWRELRDRHVGRRKFTDVVSYSGNYFIDPNTTNIDMKAKYLLLKEEYLHKGLDTKNIRMTIPTSDGEMPFDIIHDRILSSSPEIRRIPLTADQVKIYPHQGSNTNK